MAYRKIDSELRREAVAAVESGMTKKEVAERFGVSAFSVAKWCAAKEDFVDNWHKGGAIARTIPPQLLGLKSEEEESESYIPSSMVVNSTKIVKGLGTEFEYVVDIGKKQLRLGDVTIAFEKINDFIAELEGIKRQLPNQEITPEVW